MHRTLKAIHADPRFDVGIYVTGMHLLERFGSTVQEIENSGLRILARIPVVLQEGTRAEIARVIGTLTTALADVMVVDKPDLVMLLGDRGEMLAGAIVAIHLNIPVVHVHGGERSGTVDEPVRHAISKLSHYHFVATSGARERLVRMGELPDRIFIVGAPGLVGLMEMKPKSRAQLCAELALTAKNPVVLVIFHPVLQTADEAGDEMAEILAAVSDVDCQVVCLEPNSDAGSTAIRDAIVPYRTRPRFRVQTHIPRDDFVSWLRVADVLVGNSSSGIIEAASFGLPVVNVGDRQRNRERSSNVLDVPVNRAAIAAQIRAALNRGRMSCENVYGDGGAAGRIVDLLASIPLTSSVLAKCNAY